MPAKPTLTTDAETAADGTVTAVLRATWDGPAGRYNRGSGAGRRRFLEFPVSDAAFELHGLRPAIPVQVKVRAVAASGFGQSDWSPVASITTASSKAKPDNPTGLVATGTYQGVTLSWTAPAAKDIAWIEVWSIDRASVAQSPPSGSAMRKVSAGSTFSYDGTVPVETQRTYWLRSVSTSGVSADGYSAPATATNPAISGDQLATARSRTPRSWPARSRATGSRPGASRATGSSQLDHRGAARRRVDHGRHHRGGHHHAGLVGVGHRHHQDRRRRPVGQLDPGNSLKIGARGVQLVGVSFFMERDADGVLTNKFGWTEGQIVYTGDDGKPVTQAIAAATTPIDPGAWYVWWSKAQPGKLQIAKDSWAAISNDADSILIATTSNFTGLSVLVGARSSTAPGSRPGRSRPTRSRPTRSRRSTWPRERHPRTRSRRGRSRPTRSAPAPSRPTSSSWAATASS